jgi:hypothetical protein
VASGTAELLSLRNCQASFGVRCRRRRRRVSRSGRRMHAQGPGASEKRDDVDRGQPGNGRAADSYLLRHAGIGASRKWRSVAVSDRRGRSPVAVGTDRLGNGRRGSKQSCRVALWVNPLQARASSCCSSATSRSSVGDPRPRHQSGPTSHPPL